MKIDNKIITSLAGSLLLGISAWLLNTTLQIQKDIVEVKTKLSTVEETLDKVYAENCPYCVHAAHTSIAKHPLLAPTIRQAHKHLPDGTPIIINE